MFAEKESIKPEEEYRNNSGLVGRRILLNLAWVIALVLIAYLYIYSPVYSRFEFRTQEYLLWVIINFGPLLILQAIPHWLMLNHYYEKERKGNIGWLIGMPIIFYFAFSTVLALIISNTLKYN